jgi:hypothetical protein
MAAPITIEVSAFIKNADGFAIINDRPEQAHGFGVYIRNPLAFHVADFEIPAWLDSDDVRARTLAAAFDHAASLAEHLCAGVESQLDRPTVGPPMSTYDRREERDAAACLWEAGLALRSRLISYQGTSRELMPWEGAFLSDWEDNGAAAMRYMIGDLAPDCHADYLGAVEHHAYDNCFDWEYVPTWLNAALRKHYQMKGIIGRDLAPVTGNGRPMLIGDIMDGRTLGFMLMGKLAATFKTVSADKIGGAA